MVTDGVTTDPAEHEARLERIKKRLAGIHARAPEQPAAGLAPAAQNAAGAPPEATERAVSGAPSRADTDSTAIDAEESYGQPGKAPSAA